MYPWSAQLGIDKIECIEEGRRHGRRWNVLMKQRRANEERREIVSERNKVKES